jgi:Holliday junction resolvasome RuvABC endonuclease subunit
MGIDASTNSMAFCIMQAGKPISYGEIMFHGSNVYERILDASLKVRELRSQFKVDYIAIESAVLVNSAAVGIKMAYVFGAIMAELLRDGGEVREVKPLTWQSYIGTKSWTPKEKAALKAAIPGKSVSWYKAEIRKRRKQKTLDYFNKKYKIKLESDNVGDAFGVAHYLSEHL